MHNQTTLLQRMKTLKSDIQEMPIIIETLEIYNCRISEILNLQKKDIYPSRFVVLHGTKKSQDIIIRDRALLSHLETLGQNRTEKIFVHTNYKSVYNFLLKNFSHLIEKILTKKNKKVTHCFRYLATKAITNDNTVKTILHHNSLRSNKYYINKMKGSNNGTNS